MRRKIRFHPAAKAAWGLFECGTHSLVASTESICPLFLLKRRRPVAGTLQVADGAALNWQATREALNLDAAHFQSALQSGIPVSLDLDLSANAPAQLVTADYDWNTSCSGTLQIPLQP